MINGNVQIDSRRITTGDIFVAINCDNIADNIQQALDRDASFIFAEDSIKHHLPDHIQHNTKICYTNDIREFASYVYRTAYPRQPRYLAAITGTNGKTSVSKFLEHIWHYCGYQSASIGTLGISVNNNKIENSVNTTPGPQILYKTLDNMSNIGVECAVFEASSHSIAQKRFYHTNLSCIGITNITEDHGYYHGGLEQYRKTKLSILSHISQDKYAVVWRDDKQLFANASNIHKNIISFGYSTNADVRSSNVSITQDRISFNISLGGLHQAVSINNIGEYQIKNILCACAIAMISGCKPQNIIDSIATIPHVKGRFEFVANLNGGQIFIDFAHNGDGLDNCLSSLSKICKNRLICVFGVSDKDYGSRCKQMALSAKKYCDYAIVTNDNINDQTKKEIITDLICNELEQGKYTLCHDRYTAIEMAIKMLNSGDIVVISGRGHEQYLQKGDVKVDFCDPEKIFDVLSKLK